MFRYLAQFFALFIGLLVIMKSYSDWQKKKESGRMFFFWTILWVTIIAVAFFPEIIDILINKFGGQRTGLGTAFGLAIVFLLFLIYRLYVKTDRIERELTRLIRNDALKKLPKTKKKNS